MPITRVEFDERLRNLPNVIYSITGLVYTIENQTTDTVTISGDGRTYDTIIELRELYNAYVDAERLSTTVIRNYITGRKYSQAYAVLLALGLYRVNGRGATRVAE